MADSKTYHLSRISGYRIPSPPPQAPRLAHRAPRKPSRIPPVPPIVQQELRLENDEAKKAEKYQDDNAAVSSVMPEPLSLSTATPPRAIDTAEAAMIERLASQPRVQPTPPGRMLSPAFLFPSPTPTPPSDVIQNTHSFSGGLGDKIYRYKPLRGTEFRLVRILAARSSQVKCEILHRSLKDPPSYTAVSYAWGDPADSARIKIRDEHCSAFIEVPIAKSLYHALDALREKKGHVLVWADAISIDQDNRDEKNQQLSMMPDIYRKALSVAMYLGPEEDDSELAIRLLEDLASVAEEGPEACERHVKQMFSQGYDDPSLPALAALFERDYWKRLWVVQEVYNAARLSVYCGSSPPLPWEVYQTASQVFQQHKRVLEDLLPKRHSIVSQKQYSYSQILAYQGPGSLPDLDFLMGIGDTALLEVMRVCREKMCSDPKDKVFSVLGILHRDIREDFTVDYRNSVKDIYTDVVDYLLTTTERLDVICESIHFPAYINSANLPTWVPDWSHIPDVSAISLSPGTKFAASGNTKADFRFLGERRNNLSIAAVTLGSISLHGISVGTLCTLADHLMAFLNWRALLLGSDESNTKPESAQLTSTLQEDLCETLCFGQMPTIWQKRDRHAWMQACYHVFASLLMERLPRLAIDAGLADHAHINVGIKSSDRRSFLHTHFGSRMMGRCFFLTSEGRMGLGTGFMTPDDEVVVPLGCSSPILIRKEGIRGEYRFVGDAYVHGFMHGQAVEDREAGRRELKRYVLH